METPAAAPSQPDSGIPSGTKPNKYCGVICVLLGRAIVWVTFSGSPGESSGDFIQSIQRVAFQQGHPRDDRWIADYIATCFNGDALHWYSELDEEIQESWKKLRTALLRRYPAASSNPAPRSSPAPPPKPAKTPITRNVKASPGPSKSATKKSGLIELLGDRTTSLGYLCLDSESLVGITQAKASALGGNPGKERLDFPNLGLSLLGSTPGADADEIPEEIRTRKEWYENRGYDEDYSYEYESGIPTPSALCKGKSDTSIDTNASRPPIAIWILACCGHSKPTALYRRRSATKDPSRRAAAAVWKYDKNSGELRIRWLMDNDREHELGAYIQRKSSTPNLHVHRVSDMYEAGRFFDEDRVRFVFHPTQ